MSYFDLRPEVGGSFGKGTLRVPGTHPPIITKLCFVMDVWLGDALLEGFPCYIVTPELAAAIAKAGLSGVQIDSVEVTPSGIFEDMNPGRELPGFKWLRLNGTPGQDDMAADTTARLIVSERALELLRTFPLEHCETVPWSGSP